MEGASDYDVIMLKTEYISKIDVEEKGSMSDIVLPCISYEYVAKKEVCVAWERVRA